MAKKGRKGNRTYSALLKKCLRQKTNKNMSPSRRMTRCHEQIREGRSVGYYG